MKSQSWVLILTAVIGGGGVMGAAWITTRGQRATAIYQRETSLILVNKTAECVKSSEESARLGAVLRDTCKVESGTREAQETFMRGFKLSLEERQREFSEELRATSKGALASIRHWNRVVQVFGILMLCGALFFGWLNSRVFAKEDHADALVDVLNNSIDLNRESIQVLVKIQHAGTLTPEKQEELARIVETSLKKVNAVNALFDAKKLGIKPKKRKT
jgi:hypothetical protein